ncbi:MAG: TIGR02757 family protein [Bacteroidetes bacterium]|nr:TIGR02757 family protein [Bacteroidota bacterium]MBS1541328.1 TIGR02757 family protein [Bacteroidota bacterium]
MNQKTYWADLKIFLDEKADQYNRPAFITDDPVSIPHRFNKKQDIEIAGLIAAVLAWGQRKTIINKASDFLDRMDNSPHDFLLNHRPADLKIFKGYKHRTFNETDALYFIEFLSHFYKQNETLENAFVAGQDENVEQALAGFHNLFFSLDYFPERTRKHIATPQRKSACKRINMFLRWMVRNDGRGVDLGIWKTISASQLICPCDLHVERVARRLKLIKRKPMDWLTAVELTKNLKKLNPHDPVKYDFALFGLGVFENF